MEVEAHMRKSLATFCCLLGCSTVLVAAAATPNSEGAANRIATVGQGAGILSRGIEREARRQLPWRSDENVGQAQQAQPNDRSWIARHPALFGALVGAGGVVWPARRLATIAMVTSPSVAGEG